MHDYAPPPPIIGSGGGGMPAAVCLARAGTRVAVFEQNYLPGGYTREIYEGLVVANDLTLLEHTLPGLREAAVFTELGTPDTHKHCVEVTHGNLYGTGNTLRETGPFAWPVKTPIKGLLMWGASTMGRTVAGATISGMVAPRSPWAAATATCSSLPAWSSQPRVFPARPDHTQHAPRRRWRHPIAFDVPRARLQAPGRRQLRPVTHRA